MAELTGLKVGIDSTPAKQGAAEVKTALGTLGPAAREAISNVNRETAKLKESFQQVGLAARNTRDTLKSSLQSAGSSLRTDSIDNFKKALGQLGTSPSIGALKASLGQLGSSVKAAGSNFIGLAGSAKTALGGLASNIGNIAKTAFSSLGQAAKSAFSSVASGIGGALSSAGSSLLAFAAKSSGTWTALKAHLGEVSTRFGELKESIFNLRTAMEALAGAFVLREIVTAGADIERFRASLTNVLGGSAQAAAGLEELRNVSDKLGYTADALTPAFVKLAAATEHTGLVGQDTRDIFESLLISGRMVGKSNEEVAASAETMAQMLSVGAREGDSLAMVLGRIAPDAAHKVAVGLGMSDAAALKFLDTTREVDKVYRAWAKGVREEDYAKAISATKTFDSQMNRLKQTWADFLQTIAESGVMDALVETMKKLGEEMKKPEFQQLAKDFGHILAVALELGGKALVFLAEHARTVATVFGVIIALELGSHLYKIVSNSYLAAKALAALAGVDLAGLLGGLAKASGSVLKFGGDTLTALANNQAGLRGILSITGQATAAFGRMAIAQLAAALTNPWVLLAAAIAVVVGLAYHYRDAQIEVAGKNYLLRDSWNAWWIGMKDNFSGIGDDFRRLGDDFEKAVKRMEDLWTRFLNLQPVRDFLDGFKNLLQQMIDWINSHTPSLGGFTGPTGLSEGQKDVQKKGGGAIATWWQGMKENIMGESSGNVRGLFDRAAAERARADNDKNWKQINGKWYRIGSAEALAAESGSSAGAGGLDNRKGTDRVRPKTKTDSADQYRHGVQRSIDEARELAGWEETLAKATLQGGDAVRRANVDHETNAKLLELGADKIKKYEKGHTGLVASLIHEALTRASIAKLVQEANTQYKDATDAITAQMTAENRYTTARIAGTAQGEHALAQMQVEEKYRKILAQLPEEQAAALRKLMESEEALTEAQMHNTRINQLAISVAEQFKDPLTELAQKNSELSEVLEKQPQLYDEVTRAMRANEEQALGKQIEQLKATREGWAGAKAALLEYAHSATDAAANMGKTFSDLFNNLENNFTDFLTKGKADWKSMFTSLQEDVTRGFVRQNITGPLAQFVSGTFGIDIGPKPDGTRSNPIWTRDASGGAGGGLGSLLGGFGGGGGGDIGAETGGFAGLGVPGFGPTNNSGPLGLVGAAMNAFTKDSAGAANTTARVWSEDGAKVATSTTNSYSKMVSGVGGMFGKMVSTVGGWFGSMIHGIGGLFSQVIGGLGRGLGAVGGGAWSGIKGVGSAIGSAGSGIWSAIKGIGSAIGGIFGFADGGIMMPGSQLAGGGIVNSPHFALFGEGTAPEAFIPMPHGRIPITFKGRTPFVELPSGRLIPASLSGHPASRAMTKSVGGPTRFADGGILMPGSQLIGSGTPSTSRLALFGEGTTPEAFIPMPNGKIPITFQGGTPFVQLPSGQLIPASLSGLGTNQSALYGMSTGAMTNISPSGEINSGGLILPPDLAAAAGGGAGDGIPDLGPGAGRLMAALRSPSRGSLGLTSEPKGSRLPNSVQVTMQAALAPVLQAVGLPTDFDLTLLDGVDSLPNSKLVKYLTGPLKMGNDVLSRIIDAMQHKFTGQKVKQAGDTEMGHIRAELDQWMSRDIQTQFLRDVGLKPGPGIMSRIGGWLKKSIPLITAFALAPFTGGLSLASILPGALSTFGNFTKGMGGILGGLGNVAGIAGGLFGGGFAGLGKLGFSGGTALGSNVGSFGAPTGFGIGSTADFGSSLSFSNSTFSGFGGFPALATGGITSGPSLAGERGIEAVVPLPNGRSIPVDLHGGLLAALEKFPVSLNTALTNFQRMPMAKAVARNPQREFLPAAAMQNWLRHMSPASTDIPDYAMRAPTVQNYVAGTAVAPKQQHGPPVVHIHQNITTTDLGSFQHSQDQLAHRAHDAYTKAHRRNS